MKRVELPKLKCIKLLKFRECFFAPQITRIAQILSADGRVIAAVLS